MSKVPDEVNGLNSQCLCGQGYSILHSRREEPVIPHLGNSVERGPKSLQMVIAAMKFKRHLLLERKVMTNLDSILKSRDITLPKKGLSSQSCGFSRSHV